MNDEERIRAYMHGRSDVPVPDDLRWPTAASGSLRRWSISSVRAWGRLAVAGLVLIVVLAGVFSSLQLPTGPGRPTNPPASGSTLSTSQPRNATFPSEVAGLPVISVAHAVELLRAGKLDGDAVAVAGYYQEVVPSCPYPGRYIGPLESWCRFDAFADTQAGAQLCEPEGSNGMSCHQPTGTYLAPFFMSETSGDVSTWLTAGATGEPAALVLIGHAGDARQWQCTASTQGECANAFVVDRIAWAAGQDVPLAAPQTGDQQSGKPITPRMTLAQAVAAAGQGDNAVTAAAFRAGDIATIDPRWNLAGDNILWLVQSLARGTTAQGEETLPENVSLVDDATGRLIGSQPLKLAGDYQPARLWQMATVHGLDCCGNNNELAFYRVQSDNGTLVYEGTVPGGESGGTDSTTFGGSYGSGPLLLPAGRYSITSWLATYDGGAMGTPSDECSTQVTLRPLDDVALDADYPAGQTCTFRPAPSPSPGS
jgi:hypothetical protein